MRILIIGGDGMLGHQLLKSLQQRHEIKVTLHQPLANYRAFGLFNQNNSIGGIDVIDSIALQRCLAEFRPDAVCNCVALLKQCKEKDDALLNIQLNALFPHQLSLWCQLIGARLLHISSDSVFNGKKGQYAEDFPSNAEDYYGRSKFLGELHAPHTITLRTAFIGHELKNFRGLLSWFLSQTGGTVKGFSKAIFSGFTTIEMARIIEKVLTSHPEKSGVYQVASEPINKYDLLMMIKQKLQLDITIEKDDEFICYRDLDGSRFQQEFAYQPPSWASMIDELCSQCS